LAFKTLFLSSHPNSIFLLMDNEDSRTFSFEFYFFLK
jgi:hypothetical protein